MRQMRLAFSHGILSAMICALVLVMAGTGYLLVSNPLPAAAAPAPTAMTADTQAQRTASPTTGSDSTAPKGVAKKKPGHDAAILVPARPPRERILPAPVKAVDQEGGVILIGQRLTGIIDDKSDADVYQFQGLAGEAVKIEVNATSGGLDPAVTLFLGTTKSATPKNGSNSAAVDETATTAGTVPRDGLDAAASQPEDYTGMEASGIESDSAEYTATIDPLQAAWDLGFEPTGSAETGLPGIESVSFAEAALAAQVFVNITSPSDGSNVPIATNPANITLTGKAGVTGTGAPTSLEVAIIMDASGSMYASQWTLEVAGVNAILDALDPDKDGMLSSSVTIIQFSDDAQITVPLTRTRAQVEAGLTRLFSLGTDYNAAFTKALEALAPSSASDDVTEITLFFTDGGPNSGDYTPPGQGGPLDQFSPKGIQINTFGMGLSSGNSILLEIAQTTGGTYTSIPTMNDIPNVVSSLPGVVGLSSVKVDTNGDGTGDVTATVGVDGSWTAVVPIHLGPNRLTAIATATNTSLAPANSTITVLGQLSRQGEIIHDDNSGGGVNALIKIFKLPYTGKYSILVNASRSATSGDYELVLSPVDTDSNRAMVTNNLSVLHLFSTRDPNKLIFADNPPSGGTTSLLAFSPDGDSVAATNSLNQITLFSTRTDNKVIFNANPPSGGTNTFLGFGPDGSAVAILNSLGVITIYSARQDDKVICTIDPPSGGANTFLGFSPDGQSAASITSQSVFRLYSTQEDNKVIFAVNPPSGGSLTFMGFDPKGDAAAITSSLGVTSVYSTRQDDKVIFSLNPPSGGTTFFLGFGPDGDSAALTNTLNVISLFSTRQDNSVVATVNPPSGGTTTFLGYSPDAESVAVTNSLNVISILSTHTANTVLFGINPPSGGTTAFLGFSPDGEVAVATNNLNVITLFNIRNPGKIVATVNPPSGGTTTFLGFSPDGGVAMAGNSLNLLTLYSTSDADSIIFSANPPSGGSTAFLGYSPEGGVAMVANSVNVMTLYSTHTPNTVLFSVNPPSGGTTTFLGFSPDGLSAAVTNSQSVISLLSTRQADLVIFAVNPPSGGTTTFLAFSPDGQTAAVTNSLSVISLLSTRDINKLMATVNPPSGGTTSFLGFSPDADAMAVTNSLSVINFLGTREVNSLLSTVNPPSGGSTSFLSFSYDGDTAMVSNSLNILTLYSVRESNKIVFYLNPPSGGTTSFLAFSFDRTRGTIPIGPDDSCDKATKIPNLPFTETSDTAAATASPNDPAQSCAWYDTGFSSVWYKYTPAKDGILLADTEGSGYDTILSVYTGPCGGQTEVACDDDSGSGLQSAIRFQVLANTTYYFLITGFDPGGGTLIFNLDWAPAITVTSPNGGEVWSIGSSKTVTWSTIGMVKLVTVEYSTNYGYSWTAIATNITNTGSQAWTIPDKPSTSCVVRVSQATTGDPMDFSDDVFTITQAPDAPSNLRLTVASTTQINLTWQDNSTNELGFWPERKTGPTGKWSYLPVAGPNVTTFQNTGLTPGTTYYYRVRSYNTEGKSGYSNEANATTLSAGPAAPSNLAATAASGSSIRLTWTDNATTETGFKLERRSGAGSWGQIATAAANATGYTNTGLIAETVYCYRVRAYNAGGDSAYTNEACATPPSLPAAPANLTATATSISQINLAWQDLSSNEDGFRIYRKTGSGGTWSAIFTTVADVITYSDTGLATCTSYYYQLRAVNVAGSSPQSNTVSATTLCPPAAPSGLTAAAASATAVNLNWTDNSSNETGFKIERKTGTGGTFAQIATVGAGIKTYQNSGLTTGTEYCFRVRAYNVAGDSAYTGEACATPPSLPAAPANLTATATGTSQINLAWQDLSGNEDGFRIYRKTGSGGTWGAIFTTVANVILYSDTGLVSCTSYYYQLRAVNVAGSSPQSNTASATTLCPPAAPSGLTAAAASGTAINLSWTDNSTNETGFKIERKTGTAGTYGQIATVAAGITTYQNTGLTTGTNYCYRVRAYNSGGDSAYTGEACATPPSIPVAPSGLTATAVSTSQVNLAWTDGAGNETGFRIERKTGTGGTYAEIATVAANTTAYQNTGLAQGSTYYYRVRSYNAAGNSAYSNEANATPGGTAGSLYAADTIAGNMRFVPATGPNGFLQGSPNGEFCQWSDEVRFTHILTHNLAVMETEVTRQMWTGLKAVQPTLPDDPTSPAAGSGTTNPVQNCTWYQAILFANLLSVQNGFTRCYYADSGFTTPITSANYTTGDIYCNFAATGYRLPSEGEWEYFARAGTHTPFSIAESNYTLSSCASCSPGALPSLETVAWFCANGGSVSHPVGSKTANPWNLKDVHGNVWEFCWDYYIATYPTGSVTDYHGPDVASYRIIRSGSWNNPPSENRSAYRGIVVEDGNYIDVGFRLVRNIS